MNISFIAINHTDVVYVSVIVKIEVIHPRIRCIELTLKLFR
jgi:hypothetical protein